MKQNINDMFLRALCALGLVSLAFASVAPALASAQTANVSVTIAKYVDGQPATASSTGSASFPMQASWNATNTGAGTGNFSLSANGFNSNTPYTAVTAGMASGASYSVSEDTSGSTVGADCSNGQTFALAGYTTGNSVAAAALNTPTTSTPSLSNLTNDAAVIVWNRHCVPVPQPVSPANGEATTSSQIAIDWTDVTNPVGGITYVFQDANSSSTGASGAFSTPVFTSPARTQSQITGANLPAGTYYWHVRAVDAAGNTSAWSPVSSFVVNGSSTTPPTSTSTVQVHILKYLNGNEATASSANNYQFPMTATWQAANLNGGAVASGNYVLGTSFGGSSHLYGADTAPMNVGANYATNEITGSGSQVVAPGASCTQGQYQLVGYTTSNVSFADAASRTPTTAVPSFSNLQNDAYVIVWNNVCGTTTPPTQGTGTLTVTKYAVGGNGTFHFRGNHNVGEFDIATANSSGSKSMSVPAGRYNIEEKVQNGWLPLFNTCHNVVVRAGATSTCFVINLSISSFPWFNFGQR